MVAELVLDDVPEPDTDLVPDTVAEVEFVVVLDDVALFLPDIVVELVADTEDVDVAFFLPLIVVEPECDRLAVEVALFIPETVVEPAFVDVPDDERALAPITTVAFE